MVSSYAAGGRVRDDAAVFAALREVFQPFASRLKTTADTPNEYTLVTMSPSNKGKPMYFGSVRSGKAYVSFHLMPLYSNAKLNRMVPPELKRRMQGKTCFNFKSVDSKLFAELAQLTEAGFAGYGRMGLL